MSNPPATSPACRPAHYQKLDALLASKLATARAWDLKEDLCYFLALQAPELAGAFFYYWAIGR
jgi:hypothetical protein